MIRVLVVDDDKLARKGLISIMPWKTYGMTVVGEASNGAKALEFLDGHSVDLMFVDLVMPVVSGIELIQEARRKFPKIKFVVLTFHEDFEYVQSALRLGALDYISKVRLEVEDCEKVMERIWHALTNGSSESGKTAGRPGQDDGEKSAGESPLEEEHLQKDWLTLYWLYDSVFFERLCARTLTLNPPMRRIKSVFIQMLSKIEAVAPFAESWLEVEDLASAIEWVRRFRETRYRQADESSELSQTSVCMLKTIAYIRGHLNQPLHAEEAAARIGMSRSYFSQCFKKAVGLTFNDLIRQERLLAAQKLLCGTGNSISRIAQSVGYGDVKYFSHVFQKQTGILPSEFRAQCARCTNVACKTNNDLPSCIIDSTILL